MRPVRSLVVPALSAVLLLLLPIRSALAEEHWIEVRGPHFRVITNGSAGEGRHVVDEFEQMRYVIHYRFPTLRLEGSAPLLIVAAKDGDTAIRLEPALAKMGDRVAGNFIEGWARNCAMVRLDDWNHGARETVYHEYTHSIFHLNSHWLPTWLDEGMAEFFAYTRFMDHRIYIGAPTARSQVLAREHLLSVAELLNERPKQYISEDRKTQLFYAESWALVHYLTFAPPMDNGRKLAGFFDDLQKGEDQNAAFVERFGPIAPLNEQFHRYLDQVGSTAGVIPLPPRLDRAAYTERALSPAEASYELGTFHISEYDTATGQRLIEQSLAQDPKLAGPHEEMGYLLYGQGSDEDARAQWRQAAALDPQLYRARFALLMSGVPFGQQNAAQLQSTLGELRAIAGINPSFAPAYAEVALVEWQRGQLDAAQRAADQATRLEPWRAGYRMLDGHILLAAGHGAEAATIARSTAQFAEGTDRAEAVALWMEVPAAQRGEGPPLRYDVPAGTLVEEGTLTSLSCGNRDAGTQFAVDFQPGGSAADGPLHLLPMDHVGLGSADTLYRGERRMSPCEHSGGRRALVAYTPTQAGQGSLLWLQVLDNLPLPGSTAVAIHAAIGSAKTKGVTAK